MEYGVNVTNKFAFLGDDEDAHDPAEVLAKAEQAREKEKASGTKTAVKKVAAPAQEKKVTIAPLANKENEDIRRNQPRKDQPHRGGFGGKGPRGPRSNQKDDIAPAVGGDAMSERFGENRPPRQPRGQNFDRRNNGGADGNNRGSFGRGGNQGGGWQRSGGEHGGSRGGPRPPRNENAEGENNVPVADGQPFNRMNKPQYNRGPRNGPPRGDRNSGSDKTGVRSISKKDGFGKGNWGTENDELIGETEPTTDGDLNKTTDGAPLDTTADANDTAEHTDVQDDVEPEEKVRELTLEEWKAQQKNQKPNFNIRKAGEGGDQKIYQKLVLVKPLTGKEEDTAEEEEEINQNKREPREKPLNIEVSFSDSQRNRGGYREDRGARGGNFERGENRRSGGPGGRGGFGSGRRNFNQDSGPGSSGTGGRRQQQTGGSFNLTPESFPALGAH